LQCHRARLPLAGDAESQPEAESQPAESLPAAFSEARVVPVPGRVAPEQAAPVPVWSAAGEQARVFEYLVSGQLPD
jgi:hypothetical protein